MLVIELLALVLAVPGALVALHDVLARALAPRARLELTTARRRGRRPRTTELALTVRLRVRRM